MGWLRVHATLAWSALMRGTAARCLPASRARAHTRSSTGFSYWRFTESLLEFFMQLLGALWLYVYLQQVRQAATVRTRGHYASA